MKETVYSIVKEVVQESGRQLKAELKPELRLREDLGFDSLALATLTAMVEDKFNKDIFENGFVYTIEDIFKALEK